MNRLLAAALLLAVTAASAHEFWIVPERFDVAPGDRVGIGLMVGTGWPGEHFARQSPRIVRFALSGPAEERPIVGGDGAEPAGRVAAGAPGIAWAVYRSTEAELRLDAEPFESYLLEEGLQAIVERRARSGTSGRPGRERYSRCAKALITVASPGTARSATGFDRPVGLALELVPVSDPRRVADDGRLALRLLRDGLPLPNALVKAMREDRPGRWHSARTDTNGDVALELPRGDGVWLVNAVHMTAASPRSGHDWQSVWSSLTFSTSSQ